MAVMEMLLKNVEWWWWWWCWWPHIEENFLQRDRSAPGNGRSLADGSLRPTVGTDGRGSVHPLIDVGIDVGRKHHGASKEVVEGVSGAIAVRLSAIVPGI